MGGAHAGLKLRVCQTINKEKTVNSERTKQAAQRVMDIAGDVEMDYSEDALAVALSEYKLAIEDDLKMLGIPEHLQLPPSFRDFVVALACREAIPEGSGSLNGTPFDTLRVATAFSVKKLAERLKLETRREPPR